MKDVVLIEKLLSVIPNKYEAVRVLAKEARRINALLARGAQGEIDEKPTTMALRRFLDNKVKFNYADVEKSQPMFRDEEK